MTAQLHSAKKVRSLLFLRSKRAIRTPFAFSDDVWVCQMVFSACSLLFRLRMEPVRTPSLVEAQWNSVKDEVQRDWFQRLSEVPPDGDGGAVGVRQWSEAEPAVRYGYLTRITYGLEPVPWTEEVDRELSRGWSNTFTGRTFEEVRADVRLGWCARHPFGLSK